MKAVTWPIRSAVKESLSLNTVSVFRLLATKSFACIVCVRCSPVCLSGRRTAGDVYEGSFKDDKRHGKGTYTYFSGDVYTGDWEVRMIAKLMYEGGAE